MFVHAGMSLYGKVDQVPGLLHVATRFFHVNFVPLFPTGSFVVIEGIERPDNAPPGVPIGHHFRSILFAWVARGCGSAAAALPCRPWPKDFAACAAAATRDSPPPWRSSPSCCSPCFPRRTA